MGPFAARCDPANDYRGATAYRSVRTGTAPDSWYGHGVAAMAASCLFMLQEGSLVMREPIQDALDSRDVRT